MQAPRPREILSRTGHRPCPVPSGPWALFMSWHDLLFMHWPVPEKALRSLIPPAPISTPLMAAPGWASRRFA
jgi:uncharacterized protein YqjF (DUF2071 family)